MSAERIAGFIEFCSDKNGDMVCNNPQSWSNLIRIPLTVDRSVLALRLLKNRNKLARRQEYKTQDTRLKMKD